MVGHLEVCLIAAGHTGHRRFLAMEELFVLLVGAGVVALLPLVPALRPVVKTVVKGGLIVMGATKGPRLQRASIGILW